MRLLIAERRLGHLRISSMAVTILRRRLSLAVGLLVSLLAAPVAWAALGDLDESFGQMGMVHTRVGAGYAYATHVAVQKDGKIITLGVSEHLGGFGIPDWRTQALTLIRYNNNGTLDTSFGEGGIVQTLPYPADKIFLETARCIGLQTDGKILIAGDLSYFVDPETQRQKSSDAFILRYNTDGILDSSFGDAGRVVTDLIQDSEDTPIAIDIQDSGKLTVAAIAQTYVGGFVYTNLVLVRYNADGSLDTSFGTGSGRVYAPFENVASQGGSYALAFVNNGILLAGGFQNGGPTAFGFPFDTAVARYKYSEISMEPDPSFGIDGHLLLNVSPLDVWNVNFADYANALAVDSEGRLILAGVGSHGTGLGVSADMAITRLMPDGSLDPSFGAGTGSVLLDSGGEDRATNVVVSADGSMFVAGYADGRTLVGQLSSDGTVVTNFWGPPGDTYVPKGALNVQPDGTLIAVGSWPFNGLDDDNFAVTRLKGIPQGPTPVPTTTPTPGPMLPDLIPSTFRIRGLKPLSAAAEIYNESKAAVTTSFKVSMYLSFDKTIDSTSDIFVGNCKPAQLAPGATYYCGSELNIPDSVLPGTYYLGVIADSGNSVTESDETNNVLLVQTDSGAVVIEPNEATPSPVPTPTISLPTPTPATTASGVPDVIFKDDFESGDVAAWSGVKNVGGKIQIDEGPHLQLTVFGAKSVYLRDNSPDAEARYRARFYFNLNNLGLDPGHLLKLFVGKQRGEKAWVFAIELRTFGGYHLMRAVIRRNNGTHAHTRWTGALLAPWMAVEMDWRRASSPDASDGSLELWIQGQPFDKVENIKNGEDSIDSVLWGGVRGLGRSATGSILLDRFESRRETYIGF